MRHVQTRKDSRRAAAVWSLALGETVVWASLYYLFAALLLVWERSLGWDKAAIALGLTLALATSALTAPLAGRVIDAGRGAALLGVGALVGAGLLGLLARVETLPAFLALWAAIGATLAATLYEPCFAFVTRTLGPEARPAITRITLVAGLASTLSFPVATAIADAHGWRAAVWTAAAAAAFLAAPLLYGGARLLEASAPATHAPAAAGENRAAVRAALRRPVFWALAASLPMMGLNHGMLLNHLLGILDARGVAPATAVLAASLIGPMQVAGRLALMAGGGGRRALGLTALSFAGVALAAACLYASGWAAWLVFAFVALQGACYGVTSILKPVAIAEALGHAGFGAIAGWLAMPYLLGAAAAPWAGAAFWRLGGYDATILAAFGFATAGTIGAALATRLR
ncbi:MAG: MFS transporter [Rhodobacteraceae bacterium]|nr:MAG: MFS transporter [Paracoccaceae bacterium]